MLILPVVLVLASTLVLAYESEVRDTELSVSGVVSGAAQCGENSCLAAFPVQPEISLRLNGHHEMFFKFGLAFGNGQNLESPFNNAPWAADLEVDVENVNGHSRSNLLTAWYRYTATLGNARTLEASFGIIDATDYLDDNVFASDSRSPATSST
jgi:porin